MGRGGVATGTAGRGGVITGTPGTFGGGGVPLPAPEVKASAEHLLAVVRGVLGLGGLTTGIE